MVGIFSRFTVGRYTHRRTQSSLDERVVLPSDTEVTGATTVAAAHGIEVAVEFKPVEHPSEPLDNDPPIQCPLPEPSILNDGRIWKERVTAGMRQRPHLPVLKEGTPLDQSESIGEPKPRPVRTNCMILPSQSAPEHNILNLLEECNASSGI